MGVPPQEKSLPCSRELDVFDENGSTRGRRTRKVDNPERKKRTLGYMDKRLRWTDSWFLSNAEAKCYLILGRI